MHYSFDDILCNLFKVERTMLIDCLNLLKNNNLDDELLTLDEDRKLKCFETIFNNLGSVPTIDLFKVQYPNYDGDSNLEITNLLGAIRLFIKQRRNVLASRNLICEANKVAVEGITPEISNQISDILKSDSVELTYSNVRDRIIDYYEKQADNSGIKTGIEQVDKVIGGLKAGQVSVVAGFTGHGKSIASVSIMHSAIEQGYNVCYISLELSAEHLMYNMISRHSLDNKFTKKIEHRDLKSKSLSEECWNYVKEEIIPDLGTLPGKFYILDEQDIEAYNYFAFDRKLQEIENLCFKETGKGLDLIIVDHIQMLAFSNQTAKLSENSLINRWCNYFRSNCLDFLKSKRQVHVILVAQINRQGYLKALRNNGMYNLTALKEANEIETCASVILGIFADPLLILSNQVKVGILKNRDGDRLSEPYLCSANYAYQLIGGNGSTLSTTMANAELNDLFGISQFMNEECFSTTYNFAPIEPLGIEEFEVSDEY